MEEFAGGLDIQKLTLRQVLGSMAGRTDQFVRPGFLRIAGFWLDVWPH